jgi:hypothetical protein
MFGTRKMEIDIETEKGHFHSGRSTRPSGCMTLQIGWLHGGANWQRGSGLGDKVPPSHRSI